MTKVGSFLRCVVFVVPWVGLCQEEASALTFDSVDQGQYNMAGDHSFPNTNYVAGNVAGTSPDVLRNFFVFDLSSVSGNITSAELRLFNPNFGFQSVDPSEDYALFDVTTPASTLVGTLGRNLGRADIFADLGTGIGYGVTTVTTADNGSTVVVPLNASFVAAATATSGLLAIGGAVTTLDGSINTGELIFGFSGNPGQLVLNVPEPSAPLLLVVGLAGIVLGSGLRSQPN